MFRWRWCLMMAALTSLVLFAGCPQDPGKKPAGKAQKKAQPVAKKAKPDPAVADIPLDHKAVDDPGRIPKRSAKEPIEVTVRRILVSHRGADGSTAGRDAASAGRRAARLVAVARKKGADFKALATKFSDEAPKERGKVHAYHRGPLEADQPVLEAAMALGLGQVSDPVRAAKGYYVLMRVEPGVILSAHILVIFKGSALAKAAMKRTKAEAKKRADKYAKLAKEGKEPFHVLAGRYSDSPSKAGGGVIRPVGPGQMLPGFEPYFAALKALKPNETSEVVETRYGFHIIKRLPYRKIMVRHILIRHNDAQTKPKEPRKKAEAKALALKLRGLAKKGEDFAELAKKHSEDGSAKDGGLLAPIARGQSVAAFEQYAFALKVGHVSDVVETPFGFHVIKRER